MVVQHWLQKFFYAVLFTLAIPGYLCWLATQIPMKLPAYHHPVLGMVLIVSGALLMLCAFSDLITKGKGLPMNAFPPNRLVKKGAYAITAHPIYLGFILLAAGFSLYFASSAGLWLITPVITLCCVSLVWGYERPYLLKTFHGLTKPWLGVPARDSLLWRIGAFLALFIPWLILFESFKLAGAPPDAFDIHFAFEHHLPVFVESYPLYASAYLFVLLPFLFCDLKQLKHFVVVGWIGMVFIFLIYFSCPAIATPRTLPSPEENPHFLYQLFYDCLALEIKQAAPYTAAFPSYHVVWSLLVAQSLAALSTVWKYSAWIWALLITVSCFTTGMHALNDLLSAIVVGLILFRAPTIWLYLIQACNKLANSYSSVTFGPIRVISHFGFSFSCAVTLIAVVLLLLGVEYRVTLLTMATIGLLGAILWGWLIEGSSVSMRPLGYFGSVLGLLIASPLMLFSTYNLWLIIAGLFCAGTFAQAIGRFRCIIQGCCHGDIIRSQPQNRGFCVNAPRSRVVTLSGLSNQAIYPTQLYSAIGNIVLGIVLTRLWFLQVDASLVIGFYLIATACLRFTEEGYRGEVQTSRWFSLTLYQWLSLLYLFTGSYILTQQLGPLPAVPGLNIYDALTIAGWLLLGGCIGGVAGSVDFPQSNLPFSRLER